MSDGPNMLRLRALVRLVIVARTELQAQPIERDFLEGEERVRSRFHRRQERLFAERREISALRLITDATLEKPELLVQHLEPAIVAFHIEDGADLRALRIRCACSRKGSTCS